MRLAFAALFVSLCAGSTRHALAFAVADDPVPAPRAPVVCGVDEIQLASDGTIDRQSLQLGERVTPDRTLSGTVSEDGYHFYHLCIVRHEHEHQINVNLTVTSTHGDDNFNYDDDRAASGQRLSEALHVLGRLPAQVGLAQPHDPAAHWRVRRLVQRELQPHGLGAGPPNLPGHHLERAVLHKAAPARSSASRRWSSSSRRAAIAAPSLRELSEWVNEKRIRKLNVSNVAIC